MSNFFVQEIDLNFKPKDEFDEISFKSLLWEIMINAPFDLTDEAIKKYNENLIKIVKHLLVYFSEYSPNKDLKSIQIKDKLYSTYPNTNKFESLGLEEKVGVFQHVLWSVLSIDDIKEYFHSITPEGHKPYYVSKINCFVFSRNADTLKKPTTKYVQAKNMFN